MPLRQARQMPVGSFLDTRGGTVRLRTARDSVSGRDLRCRRTIVVRAGKRTKVRGGARELLRAGAVRV